MTYECVVVGTDGSDSALSAVRRAAEVAKDSSARLVLVTAYQSGGSEGHLLRSVSPEERSRVRGHGAAEEALARSEEAAKEIHDKVETLLVSGDPVESLLSTADRQRADLVVVGNQGVNARTQRLLGSVPTDVVQRATCDVLVAHTS